MSWFADKLGPLVGKIAGGALVAGPVGILSGAVTSIFSLFSKKNVSISTGNSTFQTGTGTGSSFSLAVLFKNKFFIIGLVLTILGGLYFLLRRKSSKGGRA